MTKRDFFRIIIKLFALYSLILTVFYYIPANISYATYGFEPIILLWTLGAIIIPVVIFFLLIRKTDLIIDALKLDKGFDDEHIKFKNFNGLKITQLALLIVGFYLIIYFIPEFLQYTFLAFKKEVAPQGVDSFVYSNIDTTVDYFYWGISGINLIIGYILISNNQRLAKWLNKKKPE